MNVAAVQMDIKIFEKERNLARVLATMEEAARVGAKIVAFPECALTGYCFETREEAWPLAETIPGPSSETLAAAAKRLDVTVIVGMIEREGETLYNAGVVVDPTGILGSYRKMHLPCLGLDKLAVVGDKPFPVFATKHGRIGINICYDCSIPEAARVLKLQGAQLLVIPTNWPWGSDSWEHTPKVRATENHFHVVACDRVGEERGFRFSGHSQVVDFMGKVHAEANDVEETIIYADLDLAAADNNRVVRVPGMWEFDRIADRRPEMYKPISEMRK
jgi:predicted amidohydrolase